MRCVVLGIAMAALFSISGQPALSQAPSPQPSPPIEMPDPPTAAQQATTEAAEPTQPRLSAALKPLCKSPLSRIDLISVTSRRCARSAIFLAPAPAF